MKGRVTTVCLALLATAGLVTPAVSAASVHTGATLPAPACSWYGETDQRDVNVGAPDLDAHYWANPLPVRAGTTVRITGTYPAARYFSFHTYNLSGQPTSTLYDQEIKPDKGSRNPFVGPTAARVNHYTLTVRFKATPKHPAANTLYLPPTSGATGQLALLVYRVYVPTDARSPQGGVKFPQLTLMSAAGAPTLTEGDCSTTPPAFGSYIWSTAAATNYPEFAPTPAVSGASRTPVWTRQFGSSLGNEQNAYLATPISRKFGDLVVIHAKAATFPNNRDGVPPYRKSQLRYWSFCVYDTNGQAGYGCAADHHASVRDGHYTYVVSDPGVRPANATAKDGVTWLPWGGVQNGAQIMMRNMLPSPGFRHAAEDITKPSQNGAARKILGAYYPKAVYCAPAVFARGGWRACFANA